MFVEYNCIRLDLFLNIRLSVLFSNDIKSIGYTNDKLVIEEVSNDKVNNNSLSKAEILAQS